MSDRLVGECLSRMSGWMAQVERASQTAERVLYR